MTTEQNIKQLISCGENSQVQFKQQWTTTKQIAAELIAFANSKGGTIIFGVQDKTSEIIGLTYEECQAISQELGNTANELIRPTLYVRTDTVKVGDKILLLANVDEGLNKPYKDLQGAIWIKQGADGEFKVTLCRLDKATQDVGKEDRKEDRKELSENQRVVLSSMVENDRITIKRMTEKTGLSDKTIRRDIIALKEMGYIARIGGRKQGHWVVLNNN